MHDKNFTGRGHTCRLRHACRFPLAALTAFCFLWLPTRAQNSGPVYPNGLSADSVNPAADAEAIARMRSKMDSIHLREHRPTVGLVLSGGGAKGAAHVGVLRYLEEMQIPVDMICGTSMGGLIGGLAAMGYDSAFMDSLLRAQDWGVMLTDRINPSYFSYQTRKYRETYNASIPFRYSDKDFQTRLEEQGRHAGPGGPGNPPPAPMGNNDLLSSLPSGYVYGFNVNNLLSSLSVGYQDDMPFDKLPIPFFCVATDMVSCKAQNWTSGQLKTAMRSTMSIPAMFKPVRYGGMILSDGGTRNNFPVDLARAMGCDIVIGVDLSDQDLGYSQVNNLFDIVMQFVTMLGKSSFDRNVGEADVFIKPNTIGYNMLSFNPVAIDTLIRRGYVAALERSDEISEIKDMVGNAAPRLQSRTATDIGSVSVPIHAVEFKGLNNRESKILQKKIKFKAGDSVNKREMERMMSEIEATGCFSSLSYNIKGKEAPYSLEFDCEKGPMHQFGAGVRLDNEEWPTFIFNLGLNTHKLSGFKLDLTARLGRNQKITGLATMDLSWLPTLNVEAQFNNVSSTLYTTLRTVGAEAGYWNHTERVYFSNIKWKRVDFQLGGQHRYYRLPWQNSYGYDMNSDRPDITSGSYLGLYVKGTIFTQDHFNYPSKGMNMSFGYDFDPIKPKCPSFTPLHTAYLNFNWVLPMGPFALVPDLHLRTLLGSPEFPALSGQQDPAYSLAHQNFVGGALADRCIEGQIPFVGFGNVYMARRNVAVLNLGLRLRAAPKLYFTALGGYLRESDNISGMFESVLPTLWGAGFEAAYNSVAGPLKLLVRWSDRFHDYRQDIGVYLSFGFDF